MLEFSGQDRVVVNSSAGAFDVDLPLRAWTLFVDGMTALVTTELEVRGIRSILLKGPAFARLLYDHDSDRPYSDTDLLVQSADRTRAERWLQETGFVRVDLDEDWMGPAPKYAHTFERRRDGARVDLHWRLSGAAASPEALWSTVSQHTIKIEVGGRAVAALDRPASALLVALHNAHHGTGRPRTLTDLDQAVERLGLEVWLEAVQLANQLGASETFAAGLRLVEAGNVLADRLGLDTPASVEMWLKTNPSTYGAWALDRFTQTSTFRGRLRIFLQVVVPPPIVMRTFFPLARGGRLGLLAAYALRPARLLAHVGPVLRDWTRARRAMQSGGRRKRVPSDGV